VNQFAKVSQCYAFSYIFWLGS